MSHLRILCAKCSNEILVVVLLFDKPVRSTTRAKLCGSKHQTTLDHSNTHQAIYGTQISEVSHSSISHSPLFKSGITPLVLVTMKEQQKATVDNFNRLEHTHANHQVTIPSLQLFDQTLCCITEIVCWTQKTHPPLAHTHTVRCSRFHTYSTLLNNWNIPASLKSQVGCSHTFLKDTLYWIPAG